MTDQRSAVAATKGRYFYFQCPVCEDVHVIPFEGEGAWALSGPIEAPTLSPSVLCSRTDRDTGQRVTLCHLIITAGVAHVCGDSPRLQNQQVPLPPLPDWAVSA